MTLIVITGQTATGKTQLAYDLAKKHKGEIINYDSRQVYKHLDIITGKIIFPDIKTHLLDIVDPKVQFSSFDFVTLANPLINSLIKKGITPILVGGTYLYLKHLLYGIDTQVPADWNLRGELNNKSVLELQKILQKANPEVFEKLNQSDRNNPHRLIRKIELYKKLTGPVKSKNTFPESNDFPGKFRISKFIGLKFKNTSSLEKSIKKRVEQRIKDGAFQEVKHLIKNGYKLTDPGLNTIGYKQIFEYYDGKLSMEKTIEQWISKELQYAKRQYTFMKKDKNIKWQLV